MNRKGRGRGRSWPDLRHYPSTSRICGTVENYEEL